MKLTMSAFGRKRTSLGLRSALLEHRAVDVVQVPDLHLLAVRALERALGVGEVFEGVQVDVEAGRDRLLALGAVNVQ